MTNSFEESIKALEALRLDIPKLGLMTPICDSSAHYINDVQWVTLCDNWRLFGAGAIDAETLQRTPVTIYTSDDLIKLLIFGTNEADVVLPEHPWTATRLYRVSEELRAIGNMLTSRRDLPLSDIKALAIEEYNEILKNIEMVN